MMTSTHDAAETTAPAAPEPIRGVFLSYRGERVVITAATPEAFRARVEDHLRRAHGLPCAESPDVFLTYDTRLRVAIRLLAECMHAHLDGDRGEAVAALRLAIAQVKAARADQQLTPSQAQRLERAAEAVVAVKALFRRAAP